MARTILHSFSADQLTSLAIDTNTQEVNAAIGYLSCWNASGYSHCTLWINAEAREINALYRKATGDEPVGYAIGAVWHEDHFGFHS